MQNNAAVAVTEFPLPVVPPLDPSVERDRRIQEALPLVRDIAGKLRRRYRLSMSFEDLCAFGVTGLIGALDRFDPARHACLTTYAYHRIRGAMLDGLRRSDRQYSFDMRRRLATERRANEYLAAKSAEARSDAPASIEDTFSDLASILSDLTTIHIASAAGRPGTDEMTPHPDEEAHQRWIANRVQQALASLPERERQIVELYYYGDNTFDEIGEKLGMSRPWAYRLHNRALRSLRIALAEVAEEAAP